MIKKDKFKNPDALYRSAPFWALNDKLVGKELRRQLNEFKKNGIGGAFLHPRGGMATEYLSDAFFDAIGECIDECKKLDMVAWLYDEDRFPSGVAGGKVLEKNVDFSQKYLVPIISEASEIKVDESTLALFLLDSQSYSRVEFNKLPSSGKVISISIIRRPPEEKFNNQSYVDVCDKEAIDCFIEVTHDKYYERFKDEFGTCIPAIFTDEPCFKPRDPKALPWTRKFLKLFYETYNYDLTKKLPELFLNIGNYTKTRFDYWNLISSLFVSSYSKNIFDWCEDKNIAYTGHFWEHVFPFPTHTGSVMPHYEFMQIPGIDMLFVSNDDAINMYGNDFNVKEVSSVANQLGKKRVLSETHGASGWALDFEYQKRATDWQLALGINLFCQHLSLYSMTSYRKRDFPQSFLDHQPWWKDYKMLGDYMGRMSYALSQGKYQADVLVMHPSSSTWTSFSPLEDNSELIKIEKSIKGLVKNLNQMRVMFDLGDDVIISRHGKVDGNRFVVGEMDYKVVILPRMTVIRGEVLNLLKEFRENGGVIIVTDTTPYIIDGVVSKDAKQFFDCDKTVKLKNDKSELASCLSKFEIERITIEEIDNKDVSNIYGHIRKLDNIKTVFLCNLDMNQSANLKVFFDSPCKVELFDGENGESSLCKLYEQDTKYYVDLSLHALNSAILLINENITVAPVKEGDASKNKLKEIELNNWAIEILDKNAINLQFAKASLNNEPYTDIDDVLAIDNSFKDKLGIEHGNIFMRQPWMYNEDEKNNTSAVKVEYPFFIDSIPSGDLMAAVELPDIFTVYINDNKVNPLESFYKDKAFVLYDIKTYVKSGENVIRLETDQYGVLVNLESVYIVGDFRLNKTDRIFSIGETNKIMTGNIVKQGYPYYSGVVSYSTDIEVTQDIDAAWLYFEEFYGVTATVRINGKKVKTIGWKPYRADITDYLKNGKNIITIEIANSLQNLLGSFDKDTNIHRATPESFYTKKHETFVPVGFSGKARIEIK